MPTLRPYQKENVDAVIAAHAKNQIVLGRAATGLGKAFELMCLAQHYSQFGRVMILVDVTKLVKQLAATCEWVTGIKPGIEMADSRANNGGLHGADPIIISTVQTQYSGNEGSERFRLFNPLEFSTLLLDECELFLAPKARSVVEWYAKGNAQLRVYGCTATPLRTDGVAMAELFETVAFDRDILWGIDEGWLVPARQAFVRVALDFSTLGVKEGEDGERDYGSEDLAKQLLVNEQALIELAKGIVHVAEARRTIVVCPNVESAKAVANYIEGEKPGQARCIYGELEDTEKDDLFASHQDGDFQFLVSVMMLCLDEKTEILTSEGWKGIDSIDSSDEVANWDDGKVFFEIPRKVIHRDRGEGEDMVSALGRRVNIRVTGGHQLIGKSLGARKFKKLAARELVGRALSIPCSGNAIPSIVEIDQPTPVWASMAGRMVSYNSWQLRKKGFSDSDSRIEAARRIDRLGSLRRKAPNELTLAECSFIGFWIGDGTVQKLQTGGISYSACQSIAYPNIIKWFDGILREMGIDFRKDENLYPSARNAGDNPHILWGFSRGTGSWCQERKGLFPIEQYLKKTGCHLLWGLSESQFDALIHGYWMADGDHLDGTPLSNRQITLNDTKRGWLDLLQAIGSVRGYRTSMRKGSRPAKSYHKQIYKLSMRKTASYQITKTLLSVEAEWKPEQVWCVETSSGNIITRRSGQVTVMGNCKGYDDDMVSCVVNCRKTRSKRLYTQILGRGTRPARGILEGLDTAEERRATIASSKKKNMLMVNMVGIDAETRDITIVDILGKKASDAVLDRAKQLTLEEGMEAEDALAQADVEVSAADEASAYQAEAEAKALDAKDEDDLYRNARQRVIVQANVDVEYSDDLRVGHYTDTTGIEPRHLDVLKRNKVPEKVISNLTPETARELSRKLIARHKAGLCSFRQAQVLQRAGYTRQETERMGKTQAKLNIDELVANNWKRPQKDEAA